jgi:hypothetical protein
MGPQFGGLDPFRWENRHQSRAGAPILCNRCYSCFLLSITGQGETSTYNVFNFFLLGVSFGVWIRRCFTMVDANGIKHAMFVRTTTKGPQCNRC